MPAGDEYYAWGSTLAAFARSASTVIESVGTAAAFDNTQVANSILLPVQGSSISSMPFVEAASTTTLWARFDTFAAAGSGSLREALAILNSAGTPVLRLQTLNATGDFQLSRWSGAAWVDDGVTFNLPYNNRYRLTLRATAGAGGEFEIYSGGVSLRRFTGLTAAVDNFASVRLTAYAANTHYSLFLATNFDNRDLLYRCPALNGAGAYGDGTGAVGDVNETPLDVTTAVGLPAVGNKRSFTKAAIAVPSGYYIDRACMAVLGRVAAPVADGRLGYKSGGSDGVSTNSSFARGYAPRGAALSVDPATAARFTQAGYNAAEPLLQAA